MIPLRVVEIQFAELPNKNGDELITAILKSKHCIVSNTTELTDLIGALALLPDTVKF